MANTVNYGWAKPTVGGDTGAWGTILNAALDDIDTDLDAVSDAAVAAQAEVDALATEVRSQPLIKPVGISYNWQVAWDGNRHLARFHQGISPLIPLDIPLPHLRVGQRITGFSSRAYRENAAEATVSLIRESGGSVTVVSSGHTIDGTESTRSTTGLTHDVLADNAYCIRITPTVMSDPLDYVFVAWVQAAVTATP